MSIGSLIKEFDDRKVVPVEIEDIEKALSARGIKHEIYWFPVDINDEVLRGQLVLWDVDADFEYPTDHTCKETRKVAAVYYAKGMDDDWVRLVCCKEMLHILDSDHAQANKRDVVQKLTEKIVITPELQDLISDGIQANTDRIADVQAAAILFPWRARELFLKDGSLGLSDVARLVDIPQRYVALVLSEGWPNLHDILVSL